MRHASCLLIVAVCLLSACASLWGIGETSPADGGAPSAGVAGSGGGDGRDAGSPSDAGKDGNSSCVPAVAGMVCVPGATFTMGSAIEGATFHEVTLATFEIMAYEVTVSQYDSCVAAGVCSPAGPRAPNVSGSRTEYCNEGVAGREHHPINCVTWKQAVAYCTWIGQRLLTEEEWQYAALRGGIRTFPWGNESPSALRLNLAGDETLAASSPWGNDGYVETAPVGSFSDGATEDGIFDLGGNVWEMVSSPWCPYSMASCNNCPLGESCVNSCDGQCATDQRVHRGGSYAESPLWASEIGGSWLNWRGAHPPDFGTDYVGFRCGRSID